MKATWEKWELHHLEAAVNAALKARQERTTELSQQLDSEVAEYKALPWYRRLITENPKTGSWLYATETEERLYCSRYAERELASLLKTVQRAERASPSSITLSNDEINLLK